MLPENQKPSSIRIILRKRRHHIRWRERGKSGRQRFFSARHITAERTSSMELRKRLQKPAGRRRWTLRQ